MDSTTFTDFITKFGESNILGFGFDNSAALTFEEEGQFTLANNYESELNMLHFILFDRKGNPYHLYKSIEHIQSILVKDANFAFTAYDRVNLRG